MYKYKNTNYGKKKSRLSVKQKRLFLFFGAIVLCTTLILGFRIIPSGEDTSDNNVGQPNSTVDTSENSSDTGQSATPSAPISDKAGGATSSSAPAPSNGSDLKTPEGNFVSSHKNIKKGDTIESICTTTPGATCEITFKMSSTVKSIGVKTVGASGSVSWLWTPASVGLSNGSWAITATAKLGTAVKSANDPTNLEIIP